MGVSNARGQAGQRDPKQRSECFTRPVDIAIDARNMSIFFFALDSECSCLGVQWQCECTKLGPPNMGVARLRATNRATIFQCARSLHDWHYLLVLVGNILIINSNSLNCSLSDALVAVRHLFFVLANFELNIVNSHHFIACPWQASTFTFLCFARQ